MSPFPRSETAFRSGGLTNSCQDGKRGFQGTNSISTASLFRFTTYLLLEQPHQTQKCASTPVSSFSPRTLLPLLMPPRSDSICWNATPYFATTRVSQRTVEVVSRDHSATASCCVDVNTIAKCCFDVASNQWGTARCDQGCTTATADGVFAIIMNFVQMLSVVIKSRLGGVA
jgi:hypothetical protein